MVAPVESAMAQSGDNQRAAVVPFTLPPGRVGYSFSNLRPLL
jgi:hypothetical protein